MSKYNAKKTQIDGFIFDSQLEAQRYQQLWALQVAGEIYDLKVHPVYELEPKKRDAWNGETLRPIKHELDFSYYQRGYLPLIVEDVKGVKTAVWRLKYNLFRRRYPDIMYRVVSKEDIR